MINFININCTLRLNVKFRGGVGRTKIQSQKFSMKIVDGLSVDGGGAVLRGHNTSRVKFPIFI